MLAAGHLHRTQQQAERGMILAIAPAHRPPGLPPQRPYPITDSQMEALRAAYTAVWDAVPRSGDRTRALERLAAELPVGQTPPPAPRLPEASVHAPGERPADDVRRMILARNVSTNRRVRQATQAGLRRQDRGR
ncbi:hypothetical protein [Yinghuangia seranimata]|uniref:hypothetical protein n=1 Tax=Yinghuangia seranimata TaxID=408067 RepID=UPI00248B96FB|nr:hypothetical protein [Yinghuangia seranimata]MDI2127598.1 hypothetical protein [Yinghuangia seranimata]